MNGDEYMKKIRVTAKKLLAILLCLLIAASMAVPASAYKWKWVGGTRVLFDDGKHNLKSSSVYDFLPKDAVHDFWRTYVDNRDNLEYMEKIANVNSESGENKLNWLISYLNGHMNDDIIKEQAASIKLTTVLKSYFNNTMKVVQGVSAVMSIVTSTISILKAFGIPEDKQATSMSEQLDNIIKDIQELQATVDEINRKTDEIQNTLTNEFADIDLRLQQQDYLHYKDDVWAKFYTDAVVPLNTLQARYSDNVTMQMVNYVEQWQNGSSKTDLRSLFGRNDEGELIQVFSGNNLIGAGEHLNAAPKISTDEIPVDYAITLPAEYISANIDKTENINSGTCIDTLTEAVEKGVYAAAEDGKLSAYRGFYDEWNAYTEEEKKAQAKSLAAYLADTVAFEAAYETANEKSFASSVKTAYQNFALWLMGNDSLTSPLIAQLKMLSLTHAFEGEIIDQANDVAYYICMMNLNFCSFAEMVVSMSKAHNDDDSLDIRDLYMMSETNMSVDYSEFITGNPNYCYPAEQVLEYKPAVVESTVSFIYDKPKYEEHPNTAVWFDGNVSNTGWQLFEKDGNYASRDEKAKSQQDLLSRSITTIDAKVIYAMYTTSGFEGTFGEYLAYNKVITDADKVTDKVLTTFTSSALDLRKGTDLTCHWAAGIGDYEHIEFENGKEYTVPGDKLDEGKYLVNDKATGGVFDLVTGNSDENALVACRSFYGDKYKIYAFSNTDYSFTKKEITDSERLMKLNLLDKSNNNYVYDATGTYSADYGMFVSADAGTYTFPAGTKTIPDNYFPSSSMIEKLIFDGTPDTIADNAFEGVGSKTYRCLLQAPFATGSLAGEWHGGYFGNAEVTLDANDGTGTTEQVVVVSSAPISNILNTFDEENRTFLGWSRFPNGAVVNPNEKMDSTELRNGVTLYAVWEYDHEHDFEVTAEGKPATCTEDGYTEEKTCKTCGYVEYEVLPATGHTCTYTKSGDNYIAKCSTCGYEATLYPKECGYQTVWGEAQDGSGIVYISALGMQGTHIGNDGIYVIKSTQYSTQSLLVYDGLNVSICFDGVDFAGNYGKVGFDAGKSNVNLTLKGENSITTLDADTFVSAGNLTIDGDGSLLLTSNYDDNPYYTPGVPFNTTGAHTVIKGGNICAMGGELFSVMINDDVTHGDLVIEKNVCFYAENGIDTIPVNGAGEKVYPVLIDNPDELVIAVDSRRFPFRVLPGRTDACIYLTSGKHDVRFINGENLYVDPEIGGSVLEKQYGDFTVLNPDDDEKAVEYSGGVLTVKKSTPITIKNTDPSTPTTDRIVIAKDISANITLDGVSIQTRALSGKYAITPVTIEDDSTANVIITLAEGSENILTAGNNMAAIRKNGASGTLTIEGSGSLSATGGQNAAAIGSTPGNTVAGIIINGGNIVAQTSGEGAAAIGAGKNEYIDISAVAKGITINGGTVTAICGNNSCAIGGAKAENIKINGGIVTAKSSVTDEYESYGGIGGCPVVVENTASVKAPFVESPVNGKGRSVELNTITVTEGKSIVIDGALFPYTSHNGENTVYIYLAKTEKQDFTPSIDVIESERGTVTYSPKVPKAGDKVTLYALENEGYSFGKFTVLPEIEIDEDNSFIMPDEAVTIGAVFNRIGTVTVKDCVNGTIIPSKTSAPSGETITLCVIPDEGMKLSGITVSPESAVLTGKKFVMPEEDVTVSCTCEPREYTVTWDVNGEKTTEKVKFGAAITAPKDPEIEGYNFIGWTPDVAATMPAEDVEYLAVFSTDPYVAEFKADSKTVAKVPYTMDDKSIKEPAVPEKVGYTGKWEAYTLAAGGITVNAIYTPVEYTARFVANGELVDTVAYTMNTVSIEEPAVPEKTGYVGKWNDYILTVGGVTVMAVYAPAVHEHTFDTEHSSNAAAHWFASTCGHDVASCLEAHTFGEGIVKGDVTEYTCTVCDYVKTVANTESGKAEELELSIIAAKDAIDKAAADGSEEILKYADEAKAEIEKLTSISAVNEKLVAALEKINGMKTDEAAANALDTLDAATASTSKGQSIVRMAKLLVNKAKSPEEVDAILADALTKLEAEESAEADVALAKTNAKEAIAEMAGEKQSDEMKSIIADVKTVIDAAQTAEQVAAAKELGEAAIQTQLDKEAADAALEEAKTSLIEAQNSLKEKTDALKEAEDKLEEANKALDKAKKDLEIAEGDIEAKTKALKEAEESLATAQKELGETKSALEQKTKALEAAQANLTAANEALEKANGQVESLTADLKKVNDELTETKSALGTANTQIDTLTADLKKANDDLTETKSKLDSANAQVTALTADLKKANDELAETKTALDKAEDDLEKANTEKADLESQLAAKETELENLRKSADAKDEKIKALEKTISDLNAAIESKNDEITAKTNAIAALEKSVDELEKTVKAKNDEITEKANEIANLEKTVSELENTVKEKEAEIAEKEKTIGDLEKSIANLEASVQAKETEVAEKTEQIRTLVNNVENLESEITIVQENIKEKTSQVEELTEKLEEAKAEIEELKVEFGICPECGKVHKDNFFGKIACFFNRIGNFFRNLFSKIFG